MIVGPLYSRAAGPDREVLRIVTESPSRPAASRTSSKPVSTWADAVPARTGILRPPVRPEMEISGRWTFNRP